MSFFTPDCFHFTMKGHEELAKGLWNNMVSFGFFYSEQIRTAPFNTIYNN